MSGRHVKARGCCGGGVGGRVVVERGVEKAREASNQASQCRSTMDGDCGGGSRVPVYQTRTAQGACCALSPLKHESSERSWSRKRVPRAGPGSGAGEWRAWDDAARGGGRGRGITDGRGGLTARQGVERVYSTRQVEVQQRPLKLGPMRNSLRGQTCTWWPDPS
jgi:hypothetical protein